MSKEFSVRVTTREWGMKDTDFDNLDDAVSFFDEANLDHENDSKYLYRKMITSDDWKILSVRQRFNGVIINPDRPTGK